MNWRRRASRIRASRPGRRSVVPEIWSEYSTPTRPRLDPAGKEFAADKYVFGDELGNRVKSVRIAWEAARETAGVTDLQLRDLRHEAGSRFDEAGVPTNYVSKILGHASLSTTTRYLNIQRRGLHLAMEKLEESQRLAEEQRRKKAEDEKRKKTAVAQPLHNGHESAPAFVSDPEDTPAGKSLPS